MVLLFYLGMTMVNKETIQASLNLGMNELKTFFKVVLQQIKVFVFMGAFFAFVMSFGDYVVPAILGGGTTYTYSYNIVDVLNINNSPKASAL